MKRLLTVIIVFGMALLAANAQAVDLKYAGSITILEGVMNDAAPAFEKSTGIKVGLSGGGSSTGIKAVLAGLVDIGGVSRDLKDEEKQRGLVGYPIGWGAVAIVANKGVPLDNLTSDQVKDIMTGKVTNWKDVGGPDLAIKVIVSTPGCACREEFQDMVLKKEPYVNGAIISPMKTLSDTVASTPGAIGPLATAVADTSKIKIIKLDGIPPTSDQVRAKKYKASREVNLVTKGPATGIAKTFIDYMLSPEGQSLVEKNFVRVK